MAKRSTARRLAMQALFEADIRQESIIALLEDVLSREVVHPETRQVAHTLATLTWEKKETLDQEISERSKGWSVERLSVVDRNILRLALYELRFTPETPPAVVINEAVELAKRFSTDESPKFINGILGAAVA